MVSQNRKMDSLIFKLDHAQVKSIRRRTGKRLSKIFALSILFFTFMLLFMGYAKFNNIYFYALPLVVVYIVMAGVLFLVTKLAVSNLLNRFQITIDKEEIRKMEGVSEIVSIPWIFLDIKSLPNGILSLTDRRISKLQQWWVGKGSIQVPVELAGREKFERIVMKLDKENKSQHQINKKWLIRNPKAQ